MDSQFLPSSIMHSQTKVGLLSWQFQFSSQPCCILDFAVIGLCSSVGWCVHFIIHTFESIALISRQLHFSLAICSIPFLSDVMHLLHDDIYTTFQDSLRSIRALTKPRPSKKCKVYELYYIRLWHRACAWQNSLLFTSSIANWNKQAKINPRCYLIGEVKRFLFTIPALHSSFMEGLLRQSHIPSIGYIKYWHGLHIA